MFETERELSQNKTQHIPRYYVAFHTHPYSSECFSDRFTGVCVVGSLDAKVVHND